MRPLRNRRAEISDKVQQFIDRCDETRASGSFEEFGVSVS
jgi:hypothetical protein